MRKLAAFAISNTVGILTASVFSQSLTDFLTLLLVVVAVDILIVYDMKKKDIDI